MSSRMINSGEVLSGNALLYNDRISCKDSAVVSFFESSITSGWNVAIEAMIAKIVFWSR